MFVLKLVFYWRVFYGIAGESPDLVVDNVQAEKLPYEEDPINFEHQRVVELLNCSEKFFLVSRTYNRSITSVMHTCLTAQSLGRNPNGTYTLRFTASTNFSKEATITTTTVTTPYTSGKHRENNAMNFSTNPGVGLEHVYKLMYLHKNKTCAVFRVQPMALPDNYFEEAMELESSDDVAEPSPENGTTPISMDRRDSNDVASSGPNNDVAPPTPDNGTTPPIAVDRRELNDVAPSSPENGTTAPQAEVRQDIDGSTGTEATTGTTLLSIDRRDSNDVTATDTTTATSPPIAEARQDSTGVTAIDTTTETSAPVAEARQDSTGVTAIDTTTETSAPVAEARHDSTVVTSPDPMDGCELLVREDVIRSGMERECYEVYERNCGREGERIFDETCYEESTAESA